MNHQELTAKIAELANIIESVARENEEDRAFAAIGLAAIKIVGEAFLDLKRIADAAEAANSRTPSVLVARDDEAR